MALSLASPAHPAAGYHGHEGGAVLRLIVDAMNVVGSRPDGWWRDRDAAVRRLVELLGRYAAAQRQQVTVVIDGGPVAGVASGGNGELAVVYARAGRDAADDRIIALLRDVAEPAAYEVVTSDRGLAARVRACGASVRGTRSLLAQLDRMGG
jgi:predicted RNA-binding protein with PIN domain